MLKLVEFGCALAKLKIKFQLFSQATRLGNTLRLQSPADRGGKLSAGRCDRRRHEQRCEEHSQVGHADSD